MTISNWNNKSIEELRLRLLVGFETGDFVDFPLEPEPSATAQLRSYYNALTAGDGERFKTAVVNALAEWHSLAFSAHTLRELLTLAAYIRAAGVLPHIRFLILSGKLGALDPSLRNEVLVTIAGVAHGFAPHAEAELILTVLFYSNDTPSYVAGNLFLGLCICRPRSVTALLARFKELGAGDLDRFPWPILQAQFAKIIPETVYLDALKNAGAEIVIFARQRFAKSPELIARIDALLVEMMLNKRINQTTGSDGDTRNAPFPSRASEGIRSRNNLIYEIVSADVCCDKLLEIEISSADRL